MNLRISTTLILFFVTLWLPLRSYASSPLELSNVLQSIRKHYPKLKQQQQYLEKSIAKNQQAKGFFDPILSGQVASQTGYYDNSYAAVGMEQALPVLGAKISAGWRLSDGVFAVYDEMLNTTDDGEIHASLKVPLLKNGFTDEKRTKIKITTIEKLRSQLMLNFNQILFETEGAVAYWKWIAAGLKHAAYQDLLFIARKRQTIIEAKVKAGSEPDIDLADNQQFIANREALVYSAEQELNESALKLSLYYRNHSGEPIAPTRSQLPHALHPHQLWWKAATTEDFEEMASTNYDTDLYLNQHPVLEYYELRLDQNREEIKLARTNLLPELNLGVKVANDVGNGGPKNINTEELKTSITLSLPLLNRDARGQMNQAKINQNIQQLEYRFAKDKIRMSLQNALQKIQLARKRVVLTSEQWRLASKLENAERLKFDLGTSNLIYVNLREEYSTKARIAYIEALFEHNASIAEFHLAAAKNMSPVD